MTKDNSNLKELEERLDFAENMERLNNRPQNRLEWYYVAAAVIGYSLLKLAESFEK